jgi:hypothetical protein
MSMQKLPRSARAPLFSRLMIGWSIFQDAWVFLLTAVILAESKCGGDNRGGCKCLYELGDTRTATRTEDSGWGRIIDFQKVAHKITVDLRSKVLWLYHPTSQSGCDYGYSVISREMPTSSVTKVQSATVRPNTKNARQRRVPNIQSRSKAPTKHPSRTASQNGGLTRLDMIAAVLKRHPRRTVRPTAQSPGRRSKAACATTEAERKPDFTARRRRSSVLLLSGRGKLAPRPATPACSGRTE